MEPQADQSDPGPRRAGVHPGSLSRRSWLRWSLGGLGLGLGGISGCVPPGTDLVVATDWPESDCRALASALAPLRISWVRAAAGGPTTGLLAPRAAGRFGSIDVILGGPAEAHAVLQVAGGLEPGGIVTRREPIGLALGPEVLVPAEPGWSGLGRRAWQDGLALTDPRMDPVLFTAAREHLSAVPWSEGYADLVRAAGRARPIGRAAGSALADLAAHRALVAPAVGSRALAVPGLDFTAWTPGTLWVEGASIVAGSRRGVAARALLEALAARTEGSADRSLPAPRPIAEVRSDGLLADLLGAVLVEAQPELRAALAALDSSDHPEVERARTWLAVPPPWPPASISQLRRSPQSAPLATELARQLVPEGAPRAWLLASWDQEPAPLDGSRLAELAAGAEGELAAEPRLRAWLRGEWVAWARQRFRRVARLAQGEGLDLRGQAEPEPETPGGART